MHIFIYLEEETAELLLHTFRIKALRDVLMIICVNKVKNRIHIDL